MNAPKYPSKTPALMIQGCTSDAGKSVLAAAICRILARRGLRPQGPRSRLAASLARVMQ